MSHPVVLHGAPIVVRAGALDDAGDELRQRLPATRLACITDHEVAPHYAARLARALGQPDLPVLTIPAGEASKTREQWARLTDELLALGLGRDSAIVALGGGVVGDLAGFVAATYMRGLPVVQLPTSLLAMIDAAIGGKTGVDTPAGKNLVGAFHHPALVLVDPSTLTTLPARHLRAGLAEAVKHAVLADESYFHWLAAHGAALTDPATLSPTVAEELVHRSIRIKADVVARDEREGGLRKVLNLGHTLGHAIEHASGYALLHGEAVAIGLVLECRLAERLGLALPGLADEVAQLLTTLGLPVSVPPALDADTLLPLTRLDKKARDGRAEYALPQSLGSMSGAERGYGITVDDEDVRAILGEALR